MEMLLALTKTTCDVSVNVLVGEELTSQHNSTVFVTVKSTINIANV